MKKLLIELLNCNECIIISCTIYECIYFRSVRKAFSNDPTGPLVESIKFFERNTAQIRSDMTLLANDTGTTTTGSHQQRHNKLIIEYIQKQMSTQVATFQKSVKEYSQNVQEREKRVSKYGSSTASADIVKAVPPSYAMFENKAPVVPNQSINKVHSTYNHSINNQNNNSNNSTIATLTTGNSSNNNTNNSTHNSLNENDVNVGDNHTTYSSLRNRTGNSMTTNAVNNTIENDITNKYYKSSIKTPYVSANNDENNRVMTHVQQHHKSTDRLSASETIEASVVRV